MQFMNMIYFYWEAHGVSDVRSSAAVEILLQHFVNLSSESDVMISKLTPGNEQEIKSVVMEPVITMNMSRNLKCDKQHDFYNSSVSAPYFEGQLPDANLHETYQSSRWKLFSKNRFPWFRYAILKCMG